MEILAGFASRQTENQTPPRGRVISQPLHGGLGGGNALYVGTLGQVPPPALPPTQTPQMLPPHVLGGPDLPDQRPKGWMRGPMPAQLANGGPSTVSPLTPPTSATGSTGK